MGDRVRRPSVLSEVVRVKIEHSGACIDRHVLEDGSEPPRGLVNLGLGLRPESNHLGVAAALEIEDAVVAPAVLIVADQRPLRVGG